MTDEEIVVSEPDVSLYTRTSRCERIVQRYLAPIIIVRMAGNWYDVSTEICGIVFFCLR